MNDELRYLVIEGPIGVGTTTLAERIADHMGYDLALDPHDENPYLERFYAEPSRHALPTQLAFLRARLEHQKRLARVRDTGVVSDYLFARDEIFAQLTLTDEEYELYEYFVEQIRPQPPAPDLVVYLQASAETLLARINRRGRSFEANIPLEYLQKLSEVYNQFFFHYSETPLLVINTTEIDFQSSEVELKYLMEEIHRTRVGTRYYTASVTNGD